MTDAKTHSHENKAVVAVRDAASKAVAVTSETARTVADKAVAGVQANPVAVLGGGVALGIVVGALTPRSAAERKMLHAVGKRLNDTASGALDAARDTAKAEFDVLGLSRAAARDQVGKLLGGVVKALAAAGAAALTARAAANHAQAEADASAQVATPAVKKAAQAE